MLKRQATGIHPRQTHLEGEGSQRRNRDQRSHEESSDVADGGEGHAGSCALEALPSPVLGMTNHSAEGRHRHQLPRPLEHTVAVFNTWLYHV